MFEEATVNKISGKAIFVTIKKQPKCGTCGACSFGKNNEVTVPAISRIECKEGDRVKVKMPELSSPIAPVILYGMPLVLMIIGALIGIIFSQKLAVLLAFTFLGISAIIGYLLDKLIFRKKTRFVPLVVEKINPSH